MSQSTPPENTSTQSKAASESSTPIERSAAAAGEMLSAASPEMDVVSNASDASQPNQPIAVVGLGASAGGIGVIQTILQGISRDSGLAFVVVMHLSPDFESNLAQVLQTRTVLPVLQVNDVVKVEANHVYVIPPNKHIAMEDSHLHLTERNEPNGKRVAIDLFFRTLAAAYGQRSVCAVLSGSDSDGVIGLKHIKEQGGVTIAQAPEEAEYDSMPRAAIETGMVDWILAATQIAPRLLEFADNERRMHLPPEDSADGAEALPEEEKPGGVLSARQVPSADDETALGGVLALLRSRTGHDFAHYKRATVLRRIARRMQVNMLENIPSYWEFLRENPSEAPALLQDLLINVTNFFRDPESFRVLQEHIPQLFAGKTASDQVRVWVCGCATGEEAYTVAMLLNEHASLLTERPGIQIFATDIDEEVIAYARAGLYPLTIEADVSPERLQRFFVSDHGRYRVRQEIRELVLFAAHDVLKDSPFSRLDLVTCRNLLIYLKREAQERVFDVFHFSLRSGSLMFLGGSESVDETQMQFAPLEKKHRLYVRQAMARPGWKIPVLPLSPPNQVIRPRGHETSIESALAVSKPSSVAPIVAPPPKLLAASTQAGSAQLAGSMSYGELHMGLLERYAPPSLVVNENYDIVHLSERAGRYLQIASGEPTMNLLRVVHPSLRIELRTALFRATQSGNEVQLSRAALELDGATRLLDIHVRPASVAGGQSFLLVVFEDVSDVSTHNGEATSTSPTLPDNIARHLEQELQNFKAQLSATVEQYEASTEELKASNEELQAMNEELRSASEELQTSKEELQSVNEELTTVNHELKSNLDELARVNSDLQNLLSSTEIGTIFLDRQLHIKRFTPRVQDLFNLLATDVGRPLSDITHRVEYGGFALDALQVLKDLTPIEREVSTHNNQWFIARLLPYRTLDDHIDGVVLNFVDITERKQSEEALRESEEQFRRAIEEAPIPVIMHAEDGEVLQISRTWTELTGYSLQDVPTLDAWLSRAYGEGANAVRGHMQEMFKGLQDTLNVEFTIRTRDEAQRHWSFSASSPGTLRDGRRFIVGMAVDITERTRAEEALRRSEARQTYLLKLGDALRPLSDPLEIQRTAMRVLGEHLQADRVLYSEVEADDRHSVIADNYARENFSKMVGRFPLSDYSNAQQSQRRGETFVLSDIRSAGESDEHAAFLAVGVQAIIGVPLHKDGHWVASLVVHQGSPRAWSPEETALVGETAERTWAAVERARAEAALAASEEKYRSLFDSIDEGFCLIEMIPDERGETIDYRFLDVNQVFERQTGLVNAAGSRVSELVPQTEPAWLEAYGAVARTGEPARFEIYTEFNTSWYQVYASRVGGAGSRQVAVVFDDITERKRHEANLGFLAEISHDLGGLTNIDETMNALGARIGAHFRASQCAFGEVSDNGQSVTVTHEWKSEKAPSLKGTYRVADYSTDEYQRACEAGETFIVRDVTADRRINAAQMTALGIDAFVTVPLVRDGAFRFNLNIYDSAPRDWRADEIELLREITSRIWTRIERARAEERVLASEEKYRTLFNSMDEAYAVVEVMADENGAWNDFRFIEVNPAFMQHTGMEFPVGKTATEILGTPNPRWAEVYGRVAQTGEAMRIEETEPLLDRIFDLNIFRLGDQGSRRVAVLFNNITERKRAAEAKFFLASIVESSEDSIVTINLDGVITSWNKGAEWLYGYPANETIGKPLTLLTLPEDLMQVLANIEKIRHSRKVEIYETVRTHQDGRQIHLEIALSPVKDDQGEVIGASTIARDVTERNSREANLAFFAETSADFAPLLSAEEIMKRVGKRLGDFLGLSRCDFSAVDEKADRIECIYDWRRDDSAPSVAGSHQISTFLSEEGQRQYAAGKVSVISDTKNHSMSGASFETLDALGIRSVVNVPYLSDGRWKFLLTVTRSQASEWREDEVELIRELAERIYIRIERARAEEALRESEERIRLAIEAADLATWEWNLESDQVFWNERHFLLFGLQPDSNPVRPELFYNHVHPDEREYVQLQLHTAIDKRKTFDVDFRAILKNGETRWMSGYGRVIEERNGRAARVSGVMFDVHEHKLAEENVRRSEERLRALIDNLPGGAAFVLNREMRYLLAGGEALRAAGFTPESFIGKHMSEALNPELVSEYSPYFEKALNGELYDYEHFAHGRWFLSRGVPLRNSEGKVSGLLAVSYDITERKQVEEALRESEEHFHLLMEGTKDYAMFLMDTQRRIIYWTIGAQRIFGWTREEAIGQSGDLVFAPEDIKAGAPEQEAQAAERQDKASDIRWHLRKSGARFWADGVMTSLKDENGNLRGFAKIMRDATREKEAEEALLRAHDELLQARDELEQRVLERTAELRSEISQRQEAEQAREHLLQRIVNLQEEERSRISRELHDQMGQQLTALMVGLKSLSNFMDSEGHSTSSGHQVEYLENMGEELMQQMHQLAWELRPSVLDNFGLEPTLRQHVQEWMGQSDIHADFMTRGMHQNMRINPEVETALYRVTQEALTNVQRHSGASQVSVVLERRRDGLILIIEDNGHGFDAEGAIEGKSQRLGLTGMRERLFLVGGSLEIESSGNGTTVYAHVPLGE